ncbi:hypothetical protein T06_5927, partial [Trichinella sp. T6]
LERVKMNDILFMYLKSNLLPVDILTVKGKWPYRYVSEFPLRYVKTIEDVWIPYTMCHNGCHIVHKRHQKLAGKIFA